MENYLFKYVSTSHLQAGSGHIGLTLERQGGTQFVALLSVADAQRLLDELPEQVRIAALNSN
jgi:hypothetical protein